MYFVILMTHSDVDCNSFLTAYTRSLPTMETNKAQKPESVIVL